MKVSIGKYKKNSERDVKVTVSRDDIFSLDYTLSLIILPALKKYRKNLVGHPGELTQEEWEAIIDKMIHAFKRVIDDNCCDSTPEMEEGLELFGKWFFHLWL